MLTLSSLLSTTGSGAQRITYLDRTKHRADQALPRRQVALLELARPPFLLRLAMVPCCRVTDNLLLAKAEAACKRSVVPVDEGLPECLARGSDRRGRRGSILRAPGSTYISQWADRSPDAPRLLYVPWKPRVYPIKERAPNLPRNSSLFLNPPPALLSPAVTLLTNYTTFLVLYLSQHVPASFGRLCVPCSSCF